MRSVSSLGTAVQLIGLFLSHVAAHPGSARVVARDDNSTDTTFGAESIRKCSGQTWDYIIVGGGLTGLVVANRLSEDRNKCVLVIEGGDFVDSDVTTIPYEATGTDWIALTWPGIASLPEPELGNKSFNLRVAKVLGGGSVINGMVYDRGAAADYDAWEALGNRGWGWSGLRPYFLKGTTFHPPPKKTVDEFGITWDSQAYGNGPLHISISDFQFPDLNDYWNVWRGAGVPIQKDGNSGKAYGASWYPNTMDPRSGTRAHARAAYYDPITSRSNLKIVLRTTVQEIIFSDDRTPTARGVKVVNNDNQQASSFYASKEVVLAAGAVQTPKLLQLSGVGPRSVLEKANIKVKVALDAVGANFQDHPYASVVYNASNSAFPNPSTLATNATFNATSWQQYVDTHTGIYTTARGNSLAFISLPVIAQSTFRQIAGQVERLAAGDYLPSIYKNNAKLLKGVQAQRSVLKSLFLRSDAAVAEYPIPASGAFGLVALEKPLSRGTIMINAINPTGNPDIVFNTLSNPVDKTLLAACIRYFRTVWARPELKKFSLVETSPGAEYQTDDELIKRLVSLGSITPTLAHPSGTCAMMPEDLGGCVSDQLLVYGTKGLSVIDASILPIIPSAHLQATMYGVAEKAADIIKSRG